MRRAVLRAATSSPLGAALQLTLPPPSPAVHDAVECAALSSRKAARVLAALAPAMRLAMARVASSPLGAAVLLTAFPPSVRAAVWRATSFSSLGAALVLAPFAPTMRNAVRRATTFSRLEQPSSSHGRLPMTLLQAHAGVAQTQLVGLVGVVAGASVDSMGLLPQQ
jgi:hypothetical protein